MVREIGEVETDQNTAVPRTTVKIVDCGLVEIDKKYELTADQAKLNEDV